MCLCGGHGDRADCTPLCGLGEVFVNDVWACVSVKTHVSAPGRPSLLTVAREIFRGGVKQDGGKKL